MLLAGLKCQHVSAFPVYVFGSADHAAGHLAEHGACAGDESEVRTAELQRHTECLAVAACHVGAPFCRCFQNGKGRGVTHHCQITLCLVDCVSKTGEVFDDAVFVGLRHDHSRHVTFLEFFSKCLKVGHSIFLGHEMRAHTVEFGVGLDNADHLVVESGGKKHSVFLLGRVDHHKHHLGGRCRAVIHRSVCCFHARKLTDHALVFEDILKCAL